ncbi:MAG: TetR/AcrR family transcriptional regulator [Planctomycetota bacterium]
MSRPKSFDPEIALQNAMQVFWLHGFEATSIQMLLDAMGIERFSLYSTFGDKRSLFLAALGLYDRSTDENILQPLLTNPDGQAALEEVLLKRVPQNVFGDHNFRGCLLINMLIEQGPHDRELRDFGNKQQQRLFDALLAACERVHARGGLRPNLSAFDAASLVQSVMQGVVVKARSGQTLSTLRRTMQVALQGIFADSPALST